MNIVIEVEDIDTKQNLKPESEKEEILQNLRNIFSTPRGSVPGARSFGTDISFIDRRTGEARTLAIAAIYEAARQEPRVQIKDVTFTATDSGGLMARVTPEIKAE